MHGINFMERVIEDIEDVMFSISTIGEIMDPTLYFTVQCISSLLKGREKVKQSRQRFAACWENKICCRCQPSRYLERHKRCTVQGIEVAMDNVTRY